jgi:hypothetical protein
MPNGIVPSVVILCVVMHIVVVLIVVAQIRISIDFSFNKLHLLMEELEQKHLHLLQEPML